MSAALPTVPGGFRVVCADPPWRFKSNSIAKPGRNALRHYPCMAPAEIAALPVKEIVAEDAALFLWVPGPFLVIGAHIEIMRAWGFEPSASGFVWIKLNRDGSPCLGGGFTTRKNAEFCLIGKRGRSVRKAADVREVIISPKREHSRKPPEFLERVERYSDGPYLEMFARSHRDGWVSHGDESEKFQELRPAEPHQPARNNDPGTAMTPPRDFSSRANMKDSLHEQYIPNPQHNASRSLRRLR
jgi:N6-adenosine-specific RNA methylase IME4